MNDRQFMTKTKHEQAQQEAEQELLQHPPSKPGDLSIWWIPQIPGKPFRFPVGTPKEGKLLLDCLAQYDLFQLANNIKPDYCNCGGLSVWNDNEWEDWQDEHGNDIDNTEI
jgi:hypothetical protein